MIKDNPVRETLEQLIIKASAEELMPRFRQCQIDFKDDGSYLTSADLAMQTRMEKELKALYPEYGFFAEEMDHTQMQDFFNQHPDGFWCLDPIDGTSNFASGLPYFSVSLAFIKDGQVQIGIVYDPNRQDCFSAIKGQGAWLNGEKLTTPNYQLPIKKSIALIDLKRLSPELRTRLVLEPPYHSQRSLGSVALDWCWLAAGRVQLYLHGKHKLWDYAAGVLIAEEAGSYCLGLDGEPVYQLNLEARQSMGATTQTLFEQWKEYLAIQ